MSARDVANRFREERYTSTDVKLVINALKIGDGGFLRDVVASYIKYSKNIDERSLIKYLKISQDDWAAHEIISGLSILRCDDPEFGIEVLRYANGVAWDAECYAQLAAVAALPRILSSDNRVQKVLRQAVKSENVVVRDTALEAAHEFLEIPLSKMKRGLNNSDFIESVSSEVRDWLSLNL